MPQPVSPDVAWPDHPGHRIVQSVYVRNDYVMASITIDDFGNIEPVGVIEADTSGEVTADPEFWCTDCGVLVPAHVSPERIPQ